MEVIRRNTSPLFAFSVGQHVLNTHTGIAASAGMLRRRAESEEHDHGPDP
ncbi:MAG: hypothetical protein M3460_28990 [Actinomycetota bacterium]|nr:hypothetical protein [Actinomycetota bacterium]